MLEGDTLVDQGLDPRSFDIIREEFVDERDRIDNQPDREQERSRREGERRTTEVQYNAWLGKGLKWYTNPFGRGQGYDSATDAINAQRMADIVNDDDIIIDNEMVKVINDKSTKVVDGTIMPSGRDVIRRSRQFSRANILPNFPRTKNKKKRKPSKYGKELGKQLKILKKKHPRTPVIRLMKRAHRATRKKINN